MFDFFNTKKRIMEFDDSFIQFRLWLNFVSAIGLAFIAPVSTSLKGVEFQQVLWLLPFFSFVGILLSKLNGILVKNTTIQQIHKAGAIITFMFVLTPFIYSYNKFVTAIYISTIGVIDGLIFVTYAIFLVNYITKKDPMLISDYQTTRTHVWADGALIGGVLAIIVMRIGSLRISMDIGAVIDFIIVLLFIQNYKYIKDTKEREYKKEKND